MNVTSFILTNDGLLVGETHASANVHNSHANWYIVWKRTRCCHPCNFSSEMPSFVQWITKYIWIIKSLYDVKVTQVYRKFEYIYAEHDFVDPIKWKTSTWDGLKLMNNHEIGKFWLDAETYRIFKIETALFREQTKPNLCQCQWRAFRKWESTPKRFPINNILKPKTTKGRYNILIM